MATADELLEREWGWFLHANRVAWNALPHEGKQLVRWAYMRGVHTGAYQTSELVKVFEGDLLAAASKYRDGDDLKSDPQPAAEGED